MRRALRHLGQAGACLVVAWASGAFAGGTSAPRMEIAVQEGALHDEPRGAPRRTAAFDRAKELGATWVRGTLNWIHGTWNGKPITYDANYVYFPMFDSFVDEARSRGFEVELTLSGIAEDVGGANRTGKNPDPAEFARWVDAVARHFKGRVRRFSLWNEPNLPVFLQCAPASVLAHYRDLGLAIQKTTGAARARYEAERTKLYRTEIAPRNAARYRALYVAGRRALRAVIPDAQILAGELSSSHDPFAFMELAFSKGSHITADGFALHPYQFAVEPGMKTSGTGAGISRLGAIQKELRKLAREKRLTLAGGGTLPLYLTEFGYQKLEGRLFKSPSTQLPENVRAKWLPEAFEAARVAGARQMLYFNLLPTPPTYPWDTSVLDANGNPLPSFSAVERWARARGY